MQHKNYANQFHFQSRANCLRLHLSLLRVKNKLKLKEVRYGRVGIYLFIFFIDEVDAYMRNGFAN